MVKLLFRVKVSVRG